jgi:hypothetical protein
MIYELIAFLKAPEMQLKPAAEVIAKNMLKTEK